MITKNGQQEGTNETMASADKRYILLILSFFLLAYILPLGARDLVVPDETRYGEIPREMIAGGDWIVPHLNGLRYFEKPVMGYWVHAASLLLLGENNFAVRLPSALAAGLSALLIYLLARSAARRNEEDRLTPILAVLVFLSCFEVFGVGNTAVLDSLFAFFLTGTISAFYFASEAPPGSAREKGFLVLSGLGCGLAFLTKGFLGFAVPVLAVAPYLVWERRYKDLLRLGWLPILIAILVSAPWGIAIHLREPDFWRFFFWNEHIRRFIAENAQHRESFWFFFLTAPGMFLPWVFVAPAAVPGIKSLLSEKTAQTRLLKFSLCWLVLPFLFFSLSKGKLLTYILPCFPPFAVLVAFGLSHALKKGAGNRLFQGGIVVTTVLFSLILVAFAYVQLRGINGLHPYRQAWQAVMVVNGLIFLIIFLVRAFSLPKADDKILALGLSPLLFFFIIHFVIPTPIREAKAPGTILGKYVHGITAADTVISDEDSVRAVCWYLKRNDVHILDGSGELDYGLRYSDAGGRLLDIPSAVALIWRNKGRTVLIARTKNIARWQGRLPVAVFHDESGPDGYVLMKY